ncbi:esterase/lipase family protein [Kaarinaea lacus]
MATVILIHGIWMNGWDMTLLRRRLRRAGFHAIQFSYSSVRNNLKQAAEQLQQLVRRQEDDEIHFVAHSLGGLLIRRLFSDFPQQKPGRIVTIGTPHQGSLVAKRLCKFSGGRWLLGKSVEQGLLGDVPPWSAEHQIGIIAGDRSFGVGRFLTRLPKPNDGTVLVDETPLPGMSDYKILHVNHMGMVFSAAVAAEVIAFLQNGEFQK